MANPWEMDWSQPQAPQGGSAFEAVPLPKQPTPPQAQTPAQAEGDRLGNELKRAELEEKRRKRQAASDPREAALELRNVIDAAFRAKELSRDGWFSTGFGANLAKGVGGTSAAAVDGKLDVIGSNTAFERLQKMREASPTGGALGAITERELDLLKSTIASLKQGQPDEDFQGAMQQIAESYGRVLAKIPGGRQMMIERGWLPKSGGKKPTPEKAAPAKSDDIDAILRQYGVTK